MTQNAGKSCAISSSTFSFAFSFGFLLDVLKIYIEFFAACFESVPFCLFTAAERSDVSQDSVSCSADIFNVDSVFSVRTNAASATTAKRVHDRSRAGRHAVLQKHHC